MEVTQAPSALASGMEYLIEVSQKLSQATSFAEISELTRRAARELCGADGATFVLKEGNLCYYADEDAIAPLWKGRRFPIEACVSGWSMRERMPAIVEDIYDDPRIPVDAYATTFVRSLVMVPIREVDPIGAIGNYWAQPGRPPEHCVKLLRALANLTGIALQNVKLVENLRRANETLEDSLRSRDEFISVAAHELRTPLSALKIQLQLLERGARKAGSTIDSAVVVRGTDLSLRQSDRLRDLIENLLDVSSIRLGRLVLRPSRFDLSLSVSRILASYQAVLARSGLSVRTSLEPALEGEWDELRVDQILTNLLSNAAKYAPGSELEVITKREAGQAVLLVRDNGPGIQCGSEERIFARFERDVNDERVSGLGLGLYVTRKLAEAHGGRLLLEKKPGTTGAHFRVELPIAITS
jgi:signal transduction histidine kinase